MKTGILPTLALAILTASPVLAEDDCDAPTGEWKSREAVRELAEQQGWTLKRIKIDDGCYEVYGTDSTGRRFEAKIDPVTLKIKEIEGRHGHR